MRLNEIIESKEQLDVIQNYLENALYSIKSQIEKLSRAKHLTKPLTKPVYKAKSATKPKIISKPKKAPYAAPPKPFPKAKPLAPTPQQIKNQQQKSQQEYAKTVQKTLAKAPSKPMPKSLQPLPSNIISPIGGSDPELEKKLDFARRQGEQNRASGSEPHLINKNPTY